MMYLKGKTTGGFRQSGGTSRKK